MPTNDVMAENPAFDNDAEDTMTDEVINTPVKVEKKDVTEDKNELFFRGQIRSISQELDLENRVQNAITLTAPVYQSPQYTNSGRVTIFWGDNDRAGKLLKDMTVGEHVTVKAKLRTFISAEGERGSFFYGYEIAKEVVAGITGWGEHEPEKTEAYFIGNKRSEFRPHDHFLIVNIQVNEKFEDREIASYPAITLNGPYLAAYERNKDKFPADGRIGAVCTLRQRFDKRAGKEVSEWRCFALTYEEDGEMKQLPIPVFRPRRRRRPGTRTATVAASTAADDVRHISEDTEEEKMINVNGSEPVEGEAKENEIEV